MRKLISGFAWIIAPLILSACSLPVTPTPPQANVSCNELSFYLDPVLGNGTECEIVPESIETDIPMDIFTYPTHTEVTIQNYPLMKTQFSPMIYIYPVERFSQLLPDTLPRRVSDLKMIISDGTWSRGVLPFLPPNPQIQTFFAHVKVISFQGGQGVRFITEYSDGPFPINNKSILYTFQGLTDDGTYWVAVTLPISTPILPDNDVLPEGYTDESLIQNFNAYGKSVKEAIEKQEPASFLPTLATLDRLVESIFIRK